jgi:hypothetical protein
VRREAANRVTINCWYQRRCGAVCVDTSACAYSQVGCGERPVPVMTRSGLGSWAAVLAAALNPSAALHVRQAALFFVRCLLVRLSYPVVRIPGPAVPHAQPGACWTPMHPQRTASTSTRMRKNMRERRRNSGAPEGSRLTYTPRRLRPPPGLARGVWVSTRLAGYPTCGEHVACR